MLRSDALARDTSMEATDHMHIYEKKKPGLGAASPASSYSKYAHSDNSQNLAREGGL